MGVTLSSLACMLFGYGHPLRDIKVVDLGSGGRGMAGGVYMESRWTGDTV